MNKELWIKKRKWKEWNRIIKLLKIGKERGRERDGGRERGRVRHWIREE